MSLLSLSLVVQKIKSLLVHMIETTHPLHAHIRSSFYMYKVFQHLLQWLVVIRMHTPKGGGLGCRILSWVLTGDMLLDMIGTSHPLHTPTRSTSYIYNVFKSLQPWLAVIMSQHHTIPSLWGGLGRRILSWFLTGKCCRIWLEPPIPFILLPDPLHTYRKWKCLKAFNHGWQS